MSAGYVSIFFEFFMLYKFIFLLFYSLFFLILVSFVLFLTSTSLSKTANGVAHSRDIAGIVFFTSISHLFLFFFVFYFLLYLFVLLYKVGYSSLVIRSRSGATRVRSPQGQRS